MNWIINFHVSDFIINFGTVLCWAIFFQFSWWYFYEVSWLSVFTCGLTVKSWDVSYTLFFLMLSLSSFLMDCFHIKIYSKLIISKLLVSTHFKFHKYFLKNIYYFLSRKKNECSAYQGPNTPTYDNPIYDHLLGLSPNEGSFIALSYIGVFGSYYRFKKYFSSLKYFFIDVHQSFFEVEKINIVHEKKGKERIQSFPISLIFFLCDIPNRLFCL